jgi:glycosyltransferase involved in cell wall biosynthesis
LNVESEVIFLSDDLGLIPEDADIAQLLSLSDCLLFPSESEGFGLPILEAGVLGVPAVLSDIPIFQEVGAGDASYFSLDVDPRVMADTILQAIDTPAGRLRRRVRRAYRWEVILDRLIMPLLSGDFPQSTQVPGVSA